MSPDGSSSLQKPGINFPTTLHFCNHETKPQLSDFTTTNGHIKTFEFANVIIISTTIKNKFINQLLNEIFTNDSISGPN